MKNRKLLLSVIVAVGGMASTFSQVVQQPQVIPAITPQAVQLAFGQVLDVIPFVSADGYTIQLNIVPTFTEFLGYDQDNARQFQTVVGNQPLQPTPLPRFRVRQVSTTAVVWDGQTIVLGGLIAESVNKTREKVPVIGDIPFVGRLFRSESSKSTKKNLVIFVTPTIIDPAGNRVHTTDNLPYDPNNLPVQAGATTTTTTPPAR